MLFCRTARILVVLSGCAAALALGACGPVHSVTIGQQGHEVYEERDSGHGPPPHAPAHGYRRKHQHAYAHRTAAVEVVFDSGLGVYVVVGLPHHYYWNGLYLRVDGDRWYSCDHLDGAWRSRADASLPKGLRAKYAKTHKPSGKSKGKGPAKRHD